MVSAREVMTMIGESVDYLVQWQGKGPTFDDLHDDFIADARALRNDRDCDAFMDAYGVN